MKASRLAGWVLGAFLAGAAAQASAGNIFITGHDPIWHGGGGQNLASAAAFATIGINLARNGNASKFLFIEDHDGPVPSGNLITNTFLTTHLGYSGQYDVMNAPQLNALADFGATLGAYSALVVASDHGGNLSGAELQFLNAHVADIINFVNAGGGLYAEAESNQTGQIGATPRFGFLPFVVSSVGFPDTEAGNTVTPFGASLGVTTAMVNGAFSHNIFQPGTNNYGGLNPVDFQDGDPLRALTLAGLNVTINTGGVVPEPSTAFLLLAGGAVFALRRRRPASR